MIKVFVYGTLKRGEGNHRLLAGRSIFVGNAAIKGRLFDLGSFPAVTPEGDDTIQGEVYQVGPNTLEALDRLEGHPSFYTRELVKTTAGEDVFVYFIKDVEVRYKALYLPQGEWRRNSKS